MFTITSNHSDMYSDELNVTFLFLCRQNITSYAEDKLVEIICRKNKKSSELYLLVNENGIKTLFPSEVTLDLEEIYAKMYKKID